MNWLLVFIIANAPVKTDLVFPTARSCMTYERANAKVFTDRANETIRAMADQNWPKDQREQNLNFVIGQAYSGTCIPTVAPVTVRG